MNFISVNHEGGVVHFRADEVVRVIDVETVGGAGVTLYLYFRHEISPYMMNFKSRREADKLVNALKDVRVKP